MHGRAVHKYFLVFKIFIEGNMANQQGALSDPDPAACDPATDDIVDIEFDILDVESQILDVATALAERARLTSLRDFLLPPDRLAALSPANRLKFLRMHLSRIKNRLAQDSPSAPRQNEQDRCLEGSTPDSASPAPGAPEPKVPPLPPCTFSGNTRKCYAAGGISAGVAMPPAPAAAAGDGAGAAGAAGGAPAGAPAPAAPASAAAWHSLRAAQPPRLRGASLGPRKSTRRRGPTASADRCRTPAGGRAVSRWNRAMKSWSV